MTTDRRPILAQTAWIGRATEGHLGDESQEHQHHLNPQILQPFTNVSSAAAPGLGELAVLDAASGVSRREHATTNAEGLTYASRVASSRQGVRALTVVLLGLLLVATGCSRIPTKADGSVSPSTTNVVSSADNRVVVEIPGDSISRPGTLAIEPTTDSNGLEGWSIDLAGSELTGKATIRFSVPGLAADEPIPVVTYSETLDGPRSIATDVALDGDNLVVTTDHFSNWFVDRWNDVRIGATKWFTARFDDLAGLGNGSQPACPDEQPIRDDGYSVTSDSRNRVYWCFGKDNTTPILKAVNARGYGVAVEYTPGLTVTRTDRKDFIANVAQLLKSPPTRAGNDVELLAAGNEIEFALADRGARQADAVMITPDPGAYLLTALDFAVGTYTMVLERTGAKDSVNAMITTLQGEQCLVSFSELATTNLTGPDDTAKFFSKALEMALDCAAIALEDADLGVVLSGIVAPVVWVMNGVKTAIDGLTAAAETAFDPSSYRITITHPTVPTEVINVVAVDAVGNPLSGWTAKNATRTVVDCSYPYPAASSVGTDIVSCGSTADSSHTCWIHQDRQSLTCALDIWSKTFLQYRVTTRLAAVPAAEKKQPAWLELDDGTRCTLRHGGAWGGRADGLVGAYGCNGSPYVVLAERGSPTVDTSTPQWTVRVGELGEPNEEFPPPAQRTVVKAYFVLSP